MSDESRPFKGPYKIEEDCCGWWHVSTSGKTIDDYLEKSGAEQLRLALELLELLPRIEAALDWSSEGNALEQLELCAAVRAELAALKEPRP